MTIKITFHWCLTTQRCNSLLARNIVIIKRLSLVLSRKSRLTKYKSFVRPNLDYVNIIYEKSLNKSFKRKIGMVLYKAALVITGSIMGTSRFDLESLTDRRWPRRLFFFRKVIHGLLPSYLQTYHNAVSKERIYLAQQHRRKLSRCLQEPKYLRNDFFLLH